MKRAVLKLKQPALCLVDGNQPLKNLPVPQQHTRGDEQSLRLLALLRKCGVML